VNFQTFSRYALALSVALLVAACGGGGAERNPNQGGPISASPQDGFFYAGVASTITMSGGRAPYAVTSSEPQILPVPAIVNSNSFQVIPNNPGVIDAGLDPDAVPSRTIIVSIRDTTGILVTITIHVAQNFLTGYGFNFGASTCAANPPCAGGETAMIFDTTFNGSLHGLERFKLERVRGPFHFVDPLGGSNLVDSIFVDSDHNGKITSVIKVDAPIFTQIGIVRLTHVKTGATVEYNFTLNNTTATASLTAIPAAVNFVGTSSNLCGTGTSDVLIFDGAPPYTAQCIDPDTNVQPATSSSQPGRFKISATNNTRCLDNAQCVFMDSSGARVVVPVTTTKGTAATPPPALTVNPTTITLAGCGSSGSVSVVGGTGTYSTNSTSPAITAVASGNTVTVTRALHDPAGGPFVSPAVVTVTDGTSIASLTVNFTPNTTTAPPNCP
jgi:hypothetical protein